MLFRSDTRFSDPDAAATEWAETFDRSRRPNYSGSPRFVLTVGLTFRRWLRCGSRGALHFSTGATEQKAINLRGNPHVILTTGCNTWDAGLDVVVEGDAVQVTDDAVLERLAGAWGKK